MDKELEERLKAQSAEFRAVGNLCQRFRELPAIVDDYYPEARHYYEGAVRELIRALKANGREMT